MEDLDFPEDSIRFAGTAYLIAQRDGITPEEAAIRLGNLLGSPDVVAAAVAEADARRAAEEEKKQAISAKLAELQALLGQ